MATAIDSVTHYKTGEVCQIAGISKSTLFRWFKEDIVKEVESRDRRGWRLFTEDDLGRLKAEANKVIWDYKGSMK